MAPPGLLRPPRYYDPLVITAILFWPNQKISRSLKFSLALFFN